MDDIVREGVLAALMEGAPVPPRNRVTHDCRCAWGAALAACQHAAIPACVHACMRNPDRRNKSEGQGASTGVLLQMSCCLPDTQ